jgi:hypothetical protein
MLDLALFRNHAFNGVSAVAFCLSAGMFASFLYLTLYLQGVLHYSPLEAGLRFLPLTVLGFVVAPISGALSNRVPIRVLLGTGLTIVGIGLLLMNGVALGDDWTTLLVGFIGAGIGIGTTNPGIGQAAIAVVPVEKSGMGSGINTTFRQVGIATGVAGLGAVFQSRIDAKLSEQLPHAPAGLGELVASGGSRAVQEALGDHASPRVLHAADVAFISGFNEILLIAGLISLVGAVAGFALTRSSDFVQPVGERSEAAQGGPAAPAAAEPAAANPS